MSIEHILNQVNNLNAATTVNIIKTSLDATGWFYDQTSGQIVNKSRTFFQIAGFQSHTVSQPIIIQDEIGYLGILTKCIGGIPHYLMQFKIEPGNVNCIQISPTIQATKSNFTQAHGGAKPSYLDWFLNADKYKIVVDQIQSEQSSRFLGKRNRNIIVEIDGDVEESDRHMWMTMAQIKELLKLDNRVNMDSRTVLSCLPLYKKTTNEHELTQIENQEIVPVIDVNTPLARSFYAVQPDILPKIYRYINNYKMFAEGKPKLVPLYSLPNWRMVGNEFVRNENYPFKVIFCDIEIEGREVRRWGQPLFEAQGMAAFGLLTRTVDGAKYGYNGGVMEFLVRAKPEVGCFDRIELGPAVQLEATEEPSNDVEREFFRLYRQAETERQAQGLNSLAGLNGVTHNVILSEEGGRFYHEQNKNIIINCDIGDPPPGYWWCTYNTLNKLVQINNILNIQLRNLLSLL
jgi:oxidase EvaA